ncbi:hypothetical protein B0H14DRAFT_2593451 [Mycena olivaceomarginata]|nr:hypothetical protein B0H14DRAFT_2593451 [Mycena olivaceomarginata]
MPSADRCDWRALRMAHPEVGSTYRVGHAEERIHNRLAWPQGESGNNRSGWRWNRRNGRRCGKRGGGWGCSGYFASYLRKTRRIWWKDRLPSGDDNSGEKDPIGRPDETAIRVGIQRMAREKIGLRERDDEEKSKNEPIFLAGRPTRRSLSDREPGAMWIPWHQTPGTMYIEQDELRVLSRICEISKKYGNSRDPAGISTTVEISNEHERSWKTSKKKHDLVKDDRLFCADDSGRRTEVSEMNTVINDVMLRPKQKGAAKVRETGQKLHAVGLRGER